MLGELIAFTSFTKASKASIITNVYCNINSSIMTFFSISDIDKKPIKHSDEK